MLQSDMDAEVSLQLGSVLARRIGAFELRIHAALKFHVPPKVLLVLVGFVAGYAPKSQT